VQSQRPGKKYETSKSTFIMVPSVLSLNNNIKCMFEFTYERTKSDSEDLSLVCLVVLV
jgi:hypothetical protein